MAKLISAHLSQTEMKMADVDSDVIFYDYYNVLLEYKCPTNHCGLYRGAGTEEKVKLNRLGQQNKLSNQPELCSNSFHQHSVSVGLKAAINFRQKFTGRQRNGFGLIVS